MNEQKMSSRLFILTRFHEAYTKNSIHPRNKRRGQWTPDGWIPNTFWNGYDRAGLEGTAEVRRLIREFGSDWFESRSVKELKKYFGKNFTSEMRTLKRSACDQRSGTSFHALRLRSI